MRDSTGKPKYVIGDEPNGLKLGGTLKGNPKTSIMYGRMCTWYGPVIGMRKKKSAQAMDGTVRGTPPTILLISATGP